jgi:hypothetical protein
LVTNLADLPRMALDSGLSITPLGTICFVKDVVARLASDLSLAVVRLARQLRFRRAESRASLSQLPALAALAKTVQ